MNSTFKKTLIWTARQPCDFLCGRRMIEDPKKIKRKKDQQYNLIPSKKLPLVRKGIRSILGFDLMGTGRNYLYFSTQVGISKSFELKY